MSSYSVSIIVPILNGALYVRDCVGFIQAQEFTDYEVLFIIDSESTDDSVKLVQDLSRGHPNYRIILQDEGLRLGGNRNLGLHHSTGSTIWFLDVDDAPSRYFLSEMYPLLLKTNVDFVCCNFQNVGPKGFVKEKEGAEYHHKVFGPEEALTARNDEVFPVSVWSKLYRRDFLLDNELYFDESFAEDIIHTYRCVRACSSMCIYDRPLYAYRQTRNSICRKKENLDKRGTDEIASYDRTDELCKDNPEILRKNAIMKIRSSGHMSYSAFIQFAKSDKNRKSYEAYLKGSFEGWWHLHLSTLYWIALRTYVATIYKRNGSSAMNKKFW